MKMLQLMLESKLGLMVRKKKEEASVRKGYLPVTIAGEKEDDKIIRYMVPVEFLSCVWFKKLLDEYEDEIPMHAKGPITLPCSVRKFEEVIVRCLHTDTRLKQPLRINNK